MIKDYITPQMHEFWGESMNTSPLQQEKDMMTEDNVVPFEKPKKKRLATAGGGGDEPFDPNSATWLSDLNRGAVFVCMDKFDAKQFRAIELQVINKTPKTVYLTDRHGEFPSGRVVPSRFQSRFSLLEVLYNPTEAEWEDALRKSELNLEQIKQQEENHGKRDRLQGDTPGTSGELEHPPEAPKVD